MRNLLGKNDPKAKASWSRPELERKEVKVITNGGTCLGEDTPIGTPGQQPATQAPGEACD